MADVVRERPFPHIVHLRYPFDCLANTALSVVESPSCPIRDNFVRRFCHFGALAMLAHIKAERGLQCQNLPYLHTPLYCVWQVRPRCVHACSAGPPPRVNSH